MKTVKLKNRSTAADIRVLKIYHTVIDESNLLTNEASSSGLFTGQDLAKGIEFQVDDDVTQFLVQNLQEENCVGEECNVCTNISSGSLTGEFSSSNFTYKVQPGRFGYVEYDGQFTRTVRSSNDIDTTSFTHNHTVYGSVTLTIFPDEPYAFEGWYDNVNRTGTPLSTNSTVTITEYTIDGFDFHSKDWYVKYVNNEPLFRLNAIDGETITSFNTSKNENSGPHELAKFYFSDLDGDTLTVTTSPDIDNHFSLTQYSNYISLQQVTSSLDYETKTVYNMSVSVSDAETTTLLPITINVIDNLQPTVLDQTMANFGENNADGTSAGNIVTTDPEGDTVTLYNINLHAIKLSGNSISPSLYTGTGFGDPTSDPFDISPTGAITKKSGTFLNHRLINEYIYQVTADDEYNDGTSTALITIPVIPDALTVSVTGDGNNDVYVVETALSGSFIYDDTSGTSGSVATFTANLPVTWSVDVPHKVSINNSGELSVSSDINGNYNPGDTFNVTVTGTSSIGRTHDISITVNITSDTSPATITGLGTSSIAYVIESAVEDDSIYLSSNGYSGTRVQFQADQTPITWSIEPASRLKIDNSGYVTLSSNLSGSAFSHPQTIASQVVATNQYGSTTSLDFTLQITENTALDIIFDNHKIEFDTNYAISGALLVTASFNDVEGDSVDHSSFTFSESSGQLTARKSGDVYHIYALNTLSASAYSFDIGIEDEHGFSRNEETHTISIGFAQNYPPTITYSNHTVNFFTNLAVSGATLVTASISDTEGDPINYGSFTFIDPSGELNAVQDSRPGYENIFYIQANQKLSSLNYEFTASVADNHAFGTSDHSFNLQGSSTGTLINNNVFIVETGLTGLGYESTKGFGSGVSASLDVIYSPNVGGQVVQAYTSTNPAVVVDNSGNLTLGVDMSTTTSGSGDTYTSDITFTDQYGNVGTGVVNVEVTYPGTGSYVKFEAVGFNPPQVNYPDSLEESGQYATGSFILYSQYIDDGTRVAFVTASTIDAIINEDYTLSDTEFVMMNNTGSITVTAIEDKKGETVLEGIYIRLSNYTSDKLLFPFYDSAGNVLAKGVTSNPYGSILQNLWIEDTSRSYLSLIPDKTTVPEGGTVTFTLLSQNVPNGTEVLYELTTGSIYATPNTDFTMSSDRFIMNNNTATVTATILNDVVTEGNEYLKLELSNTDSAGNTTYHVNHPLVTITNVDADAPTIIITGNNPHTHEVGSTYTDAGATASDTVDGNLTTSIVVTNNVNDQVSGSYTVVYDVSDSAGNTAQATRTVNVVDTTAPVITLVGSSSVNIDSGDAYTDAGATAVDNYDGNITANITTTNSVNTSIEGTYTVKYNVSDSSGNAATEVVRTVNVVPGPRKFSYGLSNYRIDFTFSGSDDTGGGLYTVAKDSITGTGMYTANGVPETWNPVNPIQVGRSQGLHNIKKESNNGVFDGYYTWFSLSGSTGGVIGRNNDLSGGARSVDLAHSIAYGSDIDDNPTGVYSFDYTTTQYLDIRASYTVETTASLDIVFGAAIYNASSSTTPPEDLSSGWTIYKSFGNYTSSQGRETSTPGTYQVSQIGGEVNVYGTSTPLIWIKPIVGFFDPSGSAGGEPYGYTIDFFITNSAIEEVEGNPDPTSGLTVTIDGVATDTGTTTVTYEMPASFGGEVYTLTFRSGDEVTITTEGYAFGTPYIQFDLYSKNAVPPTDYDNGAYENLPGGVKYVNTFIMPSENLTSDIDLSNTF